MECKKSEGNCFTILWKLENISYCLQKKGEAICSPAFIADVIDHTQWRLSLFPRGNEDGNYVAFFLCRLSDTGADEVQITCELAFISKDGGTLKSSTIKNHSFSKGYNRGYDTFQKREDVFISRRSEFLPKDTLTARCRIWKVSGEMAEDALCIAQTRIGVEKRSYIWNVKDFSSLEAEKKCTYEIKSVENDGPLMSVDLSLTAGLSFDEIIHFDLSLQDKNIKFCALRLFLIDSSRNRVECNQDEFWFNGIAKSKQFTFSFTKKKLMANKNLYLPNDVLSLQWKMTFSQGVVSEKIEEVQYGSTCFKNKIPDAQKVMKENKMSLSHSLIENLKHFYDKQFLCDVKLKTSTSTFPAHKIILSASSSVFNAMFSSDMKEKNSDCVNIEDLSDDAVRRMLLFIYTSRMDDITWESASNLYVAADKYAILSLKNICSSYLKENLSPSNACELLLLADFHADDDLKSSVQDYILKHDKDIINSDEWKLLMDTNGKLAAETLCLRYK